MGKSGDMCLSTVVSYGESIYKVPHNGRKCLSHKWLAEGAVIGMFEATTGGVFRANICAAPC